MTSKDFLAHLYRCLWKYIILEDNFNKYWQMEDDAEYDPPSFYADHIPELINELKNDFNFKSAFSEIVGTLDLSSRPVISDFMAWYTYMEDKTGSDIFNSQRISYTALDNLVELVKTSIMPSISESEMSKNHLDMILSVIDRFTSASKSLSTRRKGKPIIRIRDEYDVQDILHVILKPFIPTIRTEEVVPGNDDRRFLKIDFLTGKGKTALECKFIRNKAHAKKISAEINDDIQTYINHPDCDNLVFFIYDPNLFIPSPTLFENKYTANQSVNQKHVKILLRIRPSN
ncbi:MAG: hypothetical protein HYV28_05940 [Ignavibacteriales bacterium]|nr:hypothetical protein [Ignavibacteriales bacterium]